MSTAVRLDELYRRPGRIVITAHRGFSARFPENTLPAFRQAAPAGADLVEFDVRGTLDRVPVILHDAALERTRTGSGPVAGYRLEELKRFTWRAPDPRLAGEDTSIPTLQEALEAIPAGTGLNIQLKETGEALLEEVLRLFRLYELHPRAYFSVSSFDDARRVRALDRRVELCVLDRGRPLTPEVLQEMKEFGCTFLQPHRRDLTPGLCGEIRRLGFQSNLYFSNTPEDHRRFISWGVQGILTDDPGCLRRTLQELAADGGPPGRF